MQFTQTLFARGAALARAAQAFVIGATFAVAALAAVATADAAPADDQRAVAALDRQYQAAVRDNDAATMDRILADDFVLVTGRGAVLGKADLLKEAREKSATYERQEDSQQSVRVWGDTAVVTALLWCKGIGNDDHKPFDYKLWFSDTYVRTPQGWRYAFGQASLRLPDTP
jgi:ketosteroid isomerase-like protein